MISPTSKGRLAQFQHHYGGECFRCNGSGAGPVRAITRDLTADEISVQLAALGVCAVGTPQEPEANTGTMSNADFMAYLFDDGHATRREVKERLERELLAGL